MTAVGSRFRRLSVRGRLMTVGVLGVAGALLLGGLLLSLVLTLSLTRSVQSQAKATADEVAGFVDADRVPDPVPVPGSQVVQVLDSRGRVVAGSLTADRLTALVTEDERRRALAGKVVRVPGNRSGVSGRLQVAAVEAGPPGARRTVVAAVPTADLDSATGTLRVLLLVLFPLLLLVIAGIAWRVVGAALRPVEELRRGAERIDEESSDDERLPVPPTRDEVSALANTLNDMLDRVAASRSTQRAFVADAAHELRSPLATMRTQLEVAQRLGDGGSLPQDLLPELGRLTALVEDLLLLARSGAATAPPAAGDVDLGRLLDDVVTRYAASRVPVGRAPPGLTAADGPGDPSGSGGPSGPRVEADEADLVRAVTNLVDNAVRHAATGVEVEALAGPTGPQVTVTDDGHGIPEQDRERVFDRFTRLDEGRDRDRGGTGLGLAIARELLRRNGASIVLEDADPGVRAVVTFESARPVS